METTTVDTKKSCMTLGTLYLLGNYGTMLHLGHAGFLVSTVCRV